MFLVGGWFGARESIAEVFGQNKPRAKSSTKEHKFPDILLWATCLLLAYLPWLSTDTPIFGGTKHWLTAYPFLCLFAGLGFDRLVTRVLPLVPERWQNPRSQAAVVASIGLLVISPGLVITADMGPWGLSTYTPIVGGASGAATLGLNRTFWGYTTMSLAPELAALPPGRAYVHDTAVQSLMMHQRDGAWKLMLQPVLNITASEVALYHHEPHMGRVEYQIWAAYGTTTPSAIGTYEGVPVVWMYKRPRQR
jgi:hypothetical protein